MGELSSGGDFSSPLAREVRERLPLFEGFAQAEEATFYGAHFHIAKRLGISNPPPAKATWSHGWAETVNVVDPQSLHSFGGRRDRHLLWNRDAERLLRQYGYRDVHGVGLPVIYVDEQRVDRIPGSLLVMPAHSLGETSHRWPDEAYADAIAAIRDRFSVVVLCLHMGCRNHGYWFREFEARGIPWVLGITGHDRNALARLQVLMRSFEFVSTNTLGSHVPYAALFGAKPSFFGPFAEMEAEDYANVAYFTENPPMLRQFIANYREAAVRRRYPEFFVDPDRAQTAEAWGRHATGVDCKVSDATLAGLLGWL